MKRSRSIIVRGALILALAMGLCTLTYAFDDLFPDDDMGSTSTGAAGGGGGGGGSILGGSDGNFDIDALFGTFQDEPEKVEEVVVKRVLPPFHGDYKVLISRPIYASYEAETKTRWVSALGEIYTYYKVSSFPRTHVFTMEQVSNVLPNSRDYSRKFGRQHYIDAARRLGATHLIYQEYQPDRSGRRSRYSMELYWIQEAGTVEKVTVEVPHNDFEAGLNTCLIKIAEAMDPGAKSTAAFGTTVWGRDMKVLEAFGNILADEGNFVPSSAEAVYAAADRAKIFQRSSGLLGVQYAGALLSGRAGSYARAVNHMEAVVSRSKDHPALQLRLAEYLRGAERYADAMRAAETASRVPALRVPASMEMAMIHQAQGNLDRARAEYSAIVQDGGGDGRVFFQLALLSIQAGRISESEEYLQRSASSGFSLDDSEYFDLGEAYAKADGYEEKAIEFLRRSLGVRQNNEQAWGAIAEVYRRTGNSQLEAEAYVNMFKVNMHGNSPRLKAAGEIFEKLGNTAKAKDAYELFLDRRFFDKDVALSLANIYFNEGPAGCRRMPNVLKGLDTIPEARELLEKCGHRVRTIDTDKTMRTKKLSPVMFSVRMSGAALAVGGVAGGLIINGVTIPNQYEKYSAWKDENGAPKMDFDPNDPDGNDARNPKKVEDMRKSIDNSMMLRNILYGAAGVGFAGFAVTFFF